MNDIEALYRCVFRLCSISSPWEKSCPNWGSKENSSRLIGVLPKPESASLRDMRIILQEVQTGFLEFLYHHPFSEDGKEVLGVLIRMRAGPPFYPTLEEFLELQQKSDFYRHTAQFLNRIS
jgi:hypothetical protein